MSFVPAIWLTQKYEGIFVKQLKNSTLFLTMRSYPVLVGLK